MKHDLPHLATVVSAAAVMDAHARTVRFQLDVVSSACFYISVPGWLVCLCMGNAEVHWTPAGDVECKLLPTCKFWLSVAMEFV